MVGRAHWAERLAAVAAETGVPGVVLGFSDGATTTVVPHGVLSTRTGVETTAESVFQIGSITKTWTATMIAQLVEEGRLAYDSTVADLLPGVRLGIDDAAGEITVRHLLSHSSGLEGDVFEDTGRGDDCVEAYVGLLGAVSHAFAPGAAYSYCNSGFVVLGRIVEVLDGRTWDASLRERLVAPLGLRDTVTLPEEAILRRAAAGHHGPPEGGRPYDAWMLPRALGPAGLITASAGDLLAFARLHVDRGLAASGERLLPAGAVTAMWEPQVDLPERLHFDATALSWRRGTWAGATVLGHDGGTLGQVARLRVAPEQGFACCVLTNAANGGALADVLVAEVFEAEAGLRAPAPLEPHPEARPTGLVRHVGTYERRGMAFEVFGDDDRLRMCITSSFGFGDDEPEVVDLLPVDGSGERFVCRSDPTEEWWLVAFSTLPDGRAQLFSSGRVAPRVAA